MLNSMRSFHARTSMRLPHITLARSKGLIRKTDRGMATGNGSKVKRAGVASAEIATAARMRRRSDRLA
ncbi:hypothetical protein D3C83_101300 [compost metagenome]